MCCGQVVYLNRYRGAATRRNLNEVRKRYRAYVRRKLDVEDYKEFIDALTNFDIFMGLDPDMRLFVEEYYKLDARTFRKS